MPIGAGPEQPPSAASATVVAKSVAPRRWRVLDIEVIPEGGCRRHRVVPTAALSPLQDTRGTAIRPRPPRAGWSASAPHRPAYIRASLRGADAVGSGPAARTRTCPWPAASRRRTTACRRPRRAAPRDPPAHRARARLRGGRSRLRLRIQRPCRADAAAAHRPGSARAVARAAVGGADRRSDRQPLPAPAGTARPADAALRRDDRPAAPRGRARHHRRGARRAAAAARAELHLPEPLLPVGPAAPAGDARVRPAGAGLRARAGDPRLGAAAHDLHVQLVDLESSRSTRCSAPSACAATSRT